jgi:mannitol 2-dehydrogenase
MKDLNSANLRSLPTAVSTPSYDRSALQTGIVHFGVGHFHRAHQAMYLDALMRAGQAAEWAIAGVGVTPVSTQMRDVLTRQDHLYTLTIKEPDGDWHSRVIGSLNDYLYACDDPGQVVSRIADPGTRIVSLTITEGGYGLDHVTGEFTGDGDLIQADLRAERPNGSWLGLLLQALRQRRARGLGGLTLMSCDNIPENGNVARAALLGFAQLKDPDMLPWLERELSFPNSMVDRVTPRTVAADREYLEREFHYHDRWPVTCEPFSQWVLEDSFVNGRPAFEDAGVEVVADVEPYELMKLRLANGTHQALCYFGHLLGYTYVHEAIADPDIHALLLRYIDEEAVPTLKPIPGLNLHQWGHTVLERFANRQIQDALARICEDTSDRIPKFLLPVIVSQLKDGGRVAATAAIVASWARYAEGVDEQGRAIDVRDPMRDALMAAARQQAVRPTAFIENTAVFGDLAQSREFSDAYVRALSTLKQDGARALLKDS